MDGEDAGVPQFPRAAAVPFESLGVLHGDVGGGDGGDLLGGGDEGDAGLGQVGRGIGTLWEAGQEILFAKHHGSHAGRSLDHVFQLEVGLGQFDEEVDGEMALSQPEFLLALAEEVVKGQDLVRGGHHGQDVAREVGPGGQLHVGDHGVEVVHAIAPDQHLDAFRQGTDQDLVDGQPALGAGLRSDTVLQIEDDGSRTFGQTRPGMVHFVEIDVAQVEL